MSIFLLETIQGTVFNDCDADRVQTPALGELAAEVGISGVLLNLLRGGNPVSTKTTDVTRSGATILKVAERRGITAGQVLLVGFGISEEHVAVSSTQVARTGPGNITVRTLLKDHDQGERVVDPSVDDAVILKTTAAAADGTYEFSGMGEGIFWIQEEDPIGFTSTTPNLVKFEVSFGNNLITITVFNDDGTETVVTKTVLDFEDDPADQTNVKDVIGIINFGDRLLDAVAETNRLSMEGDITRRMKEYILECFRDDAKNDLWVNLLNLMAPTLDIFLERAKTLGYLTQIDNCPPELLKHLGEIVNYQWREERDWEGQRECIKEVSSAYLIKGTKNSVERTLLHAGAKHATVNNLQDRIFTIRSKTIEGSSLSEEDRLPDSKVFRWGVYEIVTDKHMEIDPDIFAKTSIKSDLFDDVLKYAHIGGTDFIAGATSIGFGFVAFQDVAGPGDEVFSVDFNVGINYDVTVDVIEETPLDDSVDPEALIETIINPEAVLEEVAGTGDPDPLNPELDFVIFTENILTNEEITTLRQSRRAALKLTFVTPRARSVVTGIFQGTVEVKGPNPETVTDIRRITVVAGRRPGSRPNKLLLRSSGQHSRFAFEWDTRDLENGTYRLRVNARDREQIPNRGETEIMVEVNN